MKKDTTFKSLLLSQEEIALLLGVKRSQYAMFEIGQRELPTAALLKLSKLTNYAVNSTKGTKKELSFYKEQESKKKGALLMYLENNKLEQLQLEKKLKQLHNNYQQAARTIQFVTLFKEKEEITEREAVVLEYIQNKALTILEKNGLDLQIKNQLKLNALLAHTKELEKELEKG